MHVPFHGFQVWNATALPIRINGKGIVVLPPEPVGAADREVEGLEIMQYPPDSRIYRAAAVGEKRSQVPISSVYRNTGLRL